MEYGEFKEAEYLYSLGLYSFGIFHGSYQEPQSEGLQGATLILTGSTPTQALIMHMIMFYHPFKWSVLLQP